MKSGQLKGLYVLYLEREPARTHDIWLISKDLIETELIKNYSDGLYSKTENYKPFFSDLLFYYLAERYPDYKQQLLSTISEKNARQVLTKAVEVFLWLQSLSQFKK